MKFMTLMTALLLSMSAFAGETQSIEIAVTNTKTGILTTDEVNYRVLFFAAGDRMAVPAIPSTEEVANTLAGLTTDGIYTCSGKRFKGTIFSLSSCQKTTEIP